MKEFLKVKHITKTLIKGNELKISEVRGWQSLKNFDQMMSQEWIALEKEEVNDDDYKDLPYEVALAKLRQREHKKTLLRSSLECYDGLRIGLLQHSATHAYTSGFERLESSCRSDFQSGVYSPAVWDQNFFMRQLMDLHAKVIKVFISEKGRRNSSGDPAGFYDAIHALSCTKVAALWDDIQSYPGRERSTYKESTLPLQAVVRR